ncbi:AAA-like domain-containing protein [Calothrix sp. CCY 0018]|uniref:AAA-like domain-containing protein n=1 Tax=Calothrix sp. CCY 0018 TaxID=3103864 RepID=UPI0039C64CCF
MEAAKQRRRRGIVLTATGLKRLQTAIQSAQLQENDGIRFTQEELSIRIGVSTNTLSRLWSLKTGLDSRSVKLCFSAFDLDLTESDYTTGEEVEQFDGIEYPSGPVSVYSKLYIPRPPIEHSISQEISRPGCIIRIKAPKGMGKTSLKFRTLDYAKTLSYYTVHLDLKLVDTDKFLDLDTFLRWLCSILSKSLDIEPQLDEYWDKEIGSKLSCTLYFEACILEVLNNPFILSFDELNRVFEYPKLAQEFLPLLRSWHEKAQYNPVWYKLRLIMDYSTDIYVPLDINHSPFNIGLPIKLPEFTDSQIEELASRYGLDWQQGQAQKLMEVIGGQPALVNIAFYHLSQEKLTLEELLEQATTERGIYRHHLREKLDDLLANPDLAAAFAEILTAQTSVNLSPTVAYKLESIGLIKLTPDGAIVSRELYRSYFSQNLDEILQ